jgi:hypothetical protein
MNIEHQSKLDLDLKICVGIIRTLNLISNITIIQIALN